MVQFNINLNEVSFKPPLPDGEYTFAIIKAELQQARNANKRSGQREWYVHCELKPMEPEWNTYVVFHNWNLSRAAIEVEDPAISIKKLYEIMGEVPESSIDLNTFLSFRFIGNTGLEEYNGRPNPKLRIVIKKVE